ncbi:MAG: cobalamin biosynthesis protein CbiG [Alphaproteobacteria bacterium]|nr:cobalamin biosynthesis protein CbiG [Alphaproteobacteria bacterium]
MTVTAIIITTGITTTITTTARRSRTVATARSLFDTYLMVDWSAASTPKRGRDSIWFCQLEREAAGLRIVAHENPSTRAEAYRRLRTILLDGVARNASILIGFDFPLAYASGLGQRLGLPTPHWRAIWDTIAGLVIDDDTNASNRFAAAAELNRRISGGPFPFWGCPSRQVGPCLAMTHHRRHELEGLAERRLSDHRMRRIQPGWKLAGTGSAGSQALTGIPIVRRLRDDPVLAPYARIWPFETGLRPLAPADKSGRLIFAEIYPSQRPAIGAPDEVKDSAQVRTIGRYFADLDSRGELAAVFAGDPALSEEERGIVEREEGWVLGIVGDASTRPHPPVAKATGPSLSRKRARALIAASVAASSPARGRGLG